MVSCIVFMTSNPKKSSWASVWKVHSRSGEIMNLSNGSHIVVLWRHIRVFEYSITDFSWIQSMCDGFNPLHITSVINALWCNYYMTSWIGTCDVINVYHYNVWGPFWPPYFHQILVTSLILWHIPLDVWRHWIFQVHAIYSVTPWLFQEFHDNYDVIDIEVTL